MLLRQPVLTTVAVLTVAIGVGANTAVVSVLRTVLLNPLGLEDTAGIASATVRLEKLKMLKATNSGVEYRDLRSMKDLFSAVTAVEGRSWTAEIAGEPVRLLGRAVTQDFFRVFAQSPAAGRFFVEGATASVVLSHSLWQAQYGGDAAALGRAILLNGKPHRIVGVAHAGFRFPATAQLWSALELSPKRLNERGNNMSLAVFARLKDGVTHAQAADRVNRYIDALKADDREMQQLGYYVDLEPFAHAIAGNMRQPLWLLWGAALVVLVAACANVAALLLSRVAGRRKEMAIRLSLGAGRVQIVRQLLMESLLLGALGGAAGILVAWSAVRLLSRVTLPGKEMLSLVSLDGGMILYGLSLALVSGLLFGAAPSFSS